MVLTARSWSPAVGRGSHPSAPSLARDEPRAKTRSVGSSRRASQAALAAAVRNLRSPGQHRSAR